MPMWIIIHLVGNGGNLTGTILPDYFVKLGSTLYTAGTLTIHDRNNGLQLFQAIGKLQIAMDYIMM